MEGIELLNKESIRTFGEKENYKYLGILEAETIKHIEMKEKICYEFFKRMKKLLKTKLCCRNLIKGNLPCKIFWTILKIEKEGGTNEPKDKKVND